MRTTLTMAAALSVLALAGCGGTDADPATSSATSSTSAPAPGQPTSGSTGHADEHADEHDTSQEHGEDPGHLDVACEAELASMQGGGSGAQVLSASVAPDLTCQEAIPAVKALDAAAPFGETPPTVEAEGFTCETSTEDFDGQPIEVFRCTDDRGTLTFVRG